MIDLAEKKPLSEKGLKREKIVTPQFSKNRIVWKNDAPTDFPSYLSGDPFASALLKYFNSAYFQVVANHPSTTRNYKLAVELYLKVMESENLISTPNDICVVFDAYLKEESRSPRSKYLIYNCFRSPARQLNSVRLKGRRQKRLGLLRSIDFTEAERLALSTIDKLALNKKPPEKNDKSPNCIAQDLYEHLNIQEVDSQAIIESIRAFCAFFICEWGEIRDAIYSLSPVDALSHQLERARSLSKRAEGYMSNSWVAGLGNYPLEYFNAQYCFELVKKVNNPLLTERFVLDYLGVNSAKDSRCNIAKTVWNWAEKKSTSSDYDWIYVIEKQYTGWESRYKRSLCNTRYNNYKCLSNKETYPNIDPEYIGILNGIFPARNILGLTISEQVCMAWLFSTDRHQPSNMRWMTVGDLTITDNSISTIIDVHTLKRRASVTSGTPYDDIETIFSENSGESYKRNQTIFKAIKTYREQVIRSHAQGLSQRKKTGREDDLWLFHDIRTPSNKRISRGTLYSRVIKFFLANDMNIELAICAMEGSTSNRYVLSKCPTAKLFLELIAKIYEPFPARSKGVHPKSMGFNYIAKTAVYQKIATRYSTSDITRSDNNAAQVDDRESQLATDHDAALAFHSKATRNNVYADKLPAYLTNRNDFGARVGDEWISFARRLSGKLYDNSSVMSLADVRKHLGLQSTAENELESLNELFDSVQQEEMALDELGLITNQQGQVFIVRHPIVIANIQNQIRVIEQQLDKLEYSNEKRMRKTVIKLMYLKMILKEKFTPSEVKEAEDMYADVDFPDGDILI